MVKAVVQIVRLVTTRIQTVTIHRALLVQRGNTAIKFFKLLVLLAKHVLRVRIRPPRVYPVLPGATIVPRANIQQKMATQNRRNAKPVLPDFFKIWPETPHVTNVHPDTTPPKKDPLHALNVHPECMPTLSVPQPVKIATLIPTNPNPMLRNAFQCKRGITNQAQPPK